MRIKYWISITDFLCKNLQGVQVVLSPIYKYANMCLDKELEMENPQGTSQIKTDFTWKT